MLITEQCGFVDRRIETFDPETLLEVIRDGRFDHRLLEGGSFEVRHRRVGLVKSAVDSCASSPPPFATRQFLSDQTSFGVTPPVGKPARWQRGTPRQTTTHSVSS